VSFQQHPLDELSEQPQAGSFPVSILKKSAAAQPTPLSTVRAPKAQFRIQALHSMHLFLSVITAFRSSIINTPWGHTSAHLPQPVQRSGL